MGNKQAINSKQGTVLIMAGGTGGHVYPALAVAMELMSRGYAVEWMGSSRGIEATVVPAAGIRLHLLSVRGLRGKGLISRVLGVFYLLLACLQALRVVFTLAPKAVIGLGGYASGPGGFAAWLLRKPLYVQEQNAVPGTTNKLLARWARTVFVGFSSAFPDHPRRVISGNPVRQEILAKAEAPYHYSSDQMLKLLVIGGSLGAQAINDVIPELVERLNAQQIEISLRHQTGRIHEAAVRLAYTEKSLIGSAETGLEREVSPFIDNMADAYQWAHLVICRAGALTVSELAAMARPSILIPLPSAIDDHQTANARYLSDAGAGLLIAQKDLSAQYLLGEILKLLGDEKNLNRMSEKAKSLALPRAVAEVCDRVEESLS